MSIDLGTIGKEVWALRIAELPPENIGYEERNELRIWRENARESSLE